MGGCWVRAKRARSRWVSARFVCPVGFVEGADGSTMVEVRQSVTDLEGRPLQGQTHGLHDKTVLHVFHLHDGKVARFDVRDEP